LEFDVFVENGLNSGVQFRSLSTPDFMDGRVHGYQCEIETSARKWAGGVYDEARNGWLYPLSRNPKGQNAFVPGQWNHYRIEAIGNEIRTWINDIQCANLIDDTTAEGFIAFQVHSIRNKELEGKIVKWKNIKIKTTDLENSRKEVDSEVPEISYLSNQLTDDEKRRGWRLLWDGQTTNGWRGAKLDKFPDKGWEMNDGILTVLSSGGAESRNGGDIVTNDSFSDFELSVDFKISEGANSGIKYFVDSELNKGEGSAIGMEFQVLDDKAHPDATQGKNGNRTVGSLYDLIRAENTDSSRGKNFKGVDKWNNARIVVKGGHVEHWLNQIKVVEFDRFSQMFKALVEKSKYEKWENFGRIPEGLILLQDHGDNVSFKSIKVREF
ncbi:MAG: 3-keto-disaccharide hydrolase, partial [Aurantibacter sp.]